VRRAAIILLLVAGLLATTTTALAADYGRGAFAGSVRGQAGSTRPLTPVELQVKGKTVRVTRIGLSFSCESSLPPQARTVSTGFVRVRPGPAGGGAFINTTIATGVETIDLTVYLGLRKKKILGQVLANLWGPAESARCRDSGLFTAKK
jgi:hypothetical protein